MSAFEYVWTGVVALVWAVLAVDLIKAALTGRFSYWRQKAGKRRWPPARSESPIRFWGVWTALAAPVLGIPLLAGLGSLLSRAPA